MKTFNKVFILVALLFTASSFAANIESQTLKGTRFLPSIDIQIDQKTLDKYKDKDLTVLYVDGSKIKKSNGFFVENVIREKRFKLSTFNEPGTIKIHASEVGVEAHSIDELKRTIETPYNYLIFVLHKPGKFYWVNPATRNDPNPTPLYFEKQLSDKVKFEILVGAEDSKPGDVLTFEMIIDDVENKICVSNPKSPCTAAKVKLKQIPFKKHTR